MRIRSVPKLCMTSVQKAKAKKILMLVSPTELRCQHILSMETLGLPGT